MNQINKSFQTAQNKVIWIEEYAVDISSREIHHQKQTYRVTPKSIGVLNLLIENAGIVVTHQQFIDSVWEGSFRSQDVLAHSIRELRKIFQDHPKTPQFIETIPKVGYRLIAKIQSPEALKTQPLSIKSRISKLGRSHSRMFRYALTSIIVTSGLFLLFHPTSFLPALIVPQETPRELYQTIPLTTNLGYEIFPSFSPDGNRMIYSAKPTNSDQYDLYVKNLTTQQVTQLTNTETLSEYSAAWSPDGYQIAYMAFDQINCKLHVISLLGGAPKELSYCANARITSLDWSPDGNKIVYSYTEDGSPGNVGLFYYDLAQQNIISLNIPMTPAFSDHSPRFSQDGKYLAFLRSSSSASNVYLLNLSTTDKEARIDKLTNYSTHITGLDWINNDRQLVFSMPQKNGRTLHSFDINSRKQVQLSPVSARFPKGQPNTKNIAYVDYQLTTNMLKFNIEKKTKPTMQHLFRSTRFDTFPHINPQGTQLAFISSRTGKPELWLAKLNENSNYQASQSNGNELTHPRWSPDGRYLVYIERYLEDQQEKHLENNAKHNELVIFDTQLKVEERLTDLGNPEFASFSNDGRRIYFSTERNHQWSNYLFDRNSRKVKLVFEQGGVNPTDPSGDGFLYFTKSGGAGLWKKNLNNGKEEIIADGIGFWNQSSWRIDSSSIYYAGFCGSTESAGICKINRRNNQTEQLRAFDSVHQITSLSIDKHAKSVVIGTTENTASDIMLLAYKQ